MLDILFFPVFLFRPFTLPTNWIRLGLTLTLGTVDCHYRHGASSNESHWRFYLWSGRAGSENDSSTLHLTFYIHNSSNGMCDASYCRVTFIDRGLYFSFVHFDTLFCPSGCSVFMSHRFAYLYSFYSPTCFDFWPPKRCHDHVNPHGTRCRNLKQWVKN